jgi:signal transduction histidine kinase
VLTIKDNGRGFMVSELSPVSLHERLGLVSMRERAQLAGGELVVTSVPRTGTTIVVRVPATGAADEG